MKNFKVKNVKCRLYFIRCRGMNTECVYFVRHKIGKGLINKTMAHYQRFFAKMRACYIERKMPATAVALVACV